MNICACKDTCITIPEPFAGIVPYVLWVCAGLVALQVAIIGLRLLKWMYVFFLRPSQNPKEFGSWAMVTGCTDGIGKEYAIQLAKKGMNIVLVSRTKAKLEETQAEIEKLGVQAENHAIDLVEPTEANWSTLKAVFDRLEVGLVVNNAGMSVEHSEYLHLIDLERTTAIPKINNLTLVTICHMALPKMVERRKGCIVNLGSIVSDLPTHPLTSVYTASKAFVRHFSVCLHEEYKQYNVKISGHAPGFVATKMSKIRKTSFFTPSPAVFAAASIDKFGQDSYIFPYMPHSLQLNLFSMLPTFVLDKLVWNMLIKLRSRALAKKKRTE